jgi:hypothetical protein
MRFSVSQLPFSSPCRRTAIKPYSEQVGTYLQQAGNIGEMTSW